MAARAEVVAEARSWIGTPFHHQGRLKGVGVDCAGLVAMVARTFNFSEFDVTDYGRIPDGETLRAVLREHMDEIVIGSVLPGDVVLFRFTRYDQHLAIVAAHDAGLTIIHARQDIGRVVETGYDRVWRRRTSAAFRYRGIE